VVLLVAVDLKVPFPFPSHPPVHPQAAPASIFNVFGTSGPPIFSCAEVFLAPVIVDVFLDTSF